MLLTGKQTSALLFSSKKKPKQTENTHFSRFVNIYCLMYYSYLDIDEIMQIVES